MARWLDHEQRGRRLAARTGEDPAVAVANATAALTDAYYHAQALHQALERAQRCVHQVASTESCSDQT